MPLSRIKKLRGTLQGEKLFGRGYKKNIPFEIFSAPKIINGFPQGEKQQGSRSTTKSPKQLLPINSWTCTYCCYMRDKVHVSIVDGLKVPSQYETMHGHVILQQQQVKGTRRGIRYNRNQPLRPLLLPIRTLAPFVHEHSLLSTVHNIFKMEVEPNGGFGVEGKFKDNVSS